MRITPAVVALALTLAPATGLAQGFHKGEQFFSLAFGEGRTTVTPGDFVWVDETFPDGLPLPAHDDEVFLLDLAGGAMMADHFALVGGFEGPGAHVPDVQGRLWNLHFYGGARYWPAHRLWVEGDLGPTWLNVARGEGGAQVESSKWGLGLVGVVGYELLQRRNASFVKKGHFLAHVQARVSTNAAGGVRATTVGALLGFSTGW